MGLIVFPGIVTTYKQLDALRLQQRLDARRLQQRLDARHLQQRLDARRLQRGAGGSDND